MLELTSERAVVAAFRAVWTVASGDRSVDRLPVANRPK
jgi:hypothetical protein